MEVLKIHEYESDGKWVVKFKYWKTGDCACTSENKTLLFDRRPTNKDLLNSL